VRVSGETDLQSLLRSMQPELHDDEFVFCSLPADAPIPMAVEPLMTFQEDEGLTLIAERATAEAAGLSGAFACRMITLSVHSSLDAVGFLAAITARLAAAGISVNPVSAFHHDHLFVPADRADDALAILHDMAR
jgi:hypothetical protein